MYHSFVRQLTSQSTFAATKNAIYGLIPITKPFEVSVEGYGYAGSGAGGFRVVGDGPSVTSLLVHGKHTAPASLHLIVSATVHAAPLRPTVLLRSPEPSTRLLRSLEASTLLLSLDHHK
ncbi:hypothetical protein LWI28_000609 [Acer negundo]|uniref:Uncharacterized protein n=1 Tax=Acer negundo TaxID=4023 RepID=A0AAD5JHW1_ACENE|nr:hypothetical protein LWI28_000609 [Acer negundo]